MHNHLRRHVKLGEYFPWTFMHAQEVSVLLWFGYDLVFQGFMDQAHCGAIQDVRN